MRSVIHVITTISRGGAENQLAILVKLQIDAGYRVKVIFLKGLPELQSHLEKIGAEVDSSFTGRNFISQIFLLRSTLSEFDGIVHAHLPRAEVLCALSIRTGRLVITRHNAEKFYPTGPASLSRLMSLFVTKKSRRVICISEAVKRFVLDHKEIYNKQNIEVIYYSFNPQFRYGTLNVIKNYEESFIIGTIARLVAQKDIATLIHAFNLFQSIHKNSKLLIVGKGQLENKLRKLSQELDLEDSIIWVGHTSDVTFQYKKMDIFVLPSRYEGFGLVLLEAIQMGVPVIAARNSAITEVLGEDSLGLFETGSFEDLYHKLLQYLDRDLRRKLSQSQSGRLLNFSPEKLFKSIDSLYENVLKF